MSVSMSLSVSRILPQAFAAYARPVQSAPTTARRAAAGPRVRLSNPPQLIVLAFAVGIAIGTAVLMLPVATEDGTGASLLTALFTATSATCVTGLLVFRRLGLRTRIIAATETKTLGLGDVRRVLLSVIGFTVFFEAVAAVLLTLRFATTYDEALGRATALGVFHAISAFNNAGFSLYSDNLIGFVTDPVISLTVSFAVIAGGLGFPVLYELRRELGNPRTWSLHTRITLGTTAVLLVLGSAAVVAFDWSNPRTLGSLSVPGKLLAGFFAGVQPRTAGFNSIDYADADAATLLVTDILMFIGGGPASTAGASR
jgi:trk system potassium uptake protein TrkH